jgi:hypothetical protein
MDFKTQVAGLNAFLSAVFGAETRLSTLLESLGFDAVQIELLRTHHLEPLVQGFLAVVKERFTTGTGNARQFELLCRRYGFDGEPVETPQLLASRLRLRPEDICLLEERAIQRCKDPVGVENLKTGLRRLALAQLQAVAQPPDRKRIVEQLDALARARDEAELRRKTYEDKRAAILKPMQKQLDALDKEYETACQSPDTELSRLEAEVRNCVQLLGSSVFGSRLKATYSRGRVTWDSKGVEAYSKTHPDVLQFRKQGQPIVILKAVKPGGELSTDEQP